MFKKKKLLEKVKQTVVFIDGPPWPPYEDGLLGLLEWTKPY